MRYVALVVVLLAAVGGYSGYWFHVAGEIPPGIAQWADERRAEGFEVAYAGVEVSGFPYRLLVEVAEPSIGRGQGPSPWIWRGAALSAVAQPWDFRHLIFSFDGTHEVRYVDRGVAKVVSAEARVPMLSVVLDGAGEVERFSTDIQDLEVAASGWSRKLQARRLQLHGRRNPGAEEDRPAGSRDLALRAEDVTLPPEARAPLGAEIAALDAEATVIGTLPAAPIDAAIAAWRDDGGTVEVRKLAIDWGPLDFESSGTVALDRDMRLIGAGKARVEGYDATIDALRAGRWIRGNEAFTAKTVLGLLAKETADGNKAVTVALTAQEGLLYVGPLPLLRLPPLLPSPSPSKKPRASPLP
jgi:hypothetical protein